MQSSHMMWALHLSFYCSGVKIKVLKKTKSVILLVHRIKKERKKGKLCVNTKTHFKNLVVQLKRSKLLKEKKKKNTFSLISLSKTMKNKTKQKHTHTQLQSVFTIMHTKRLKPLLPMHDSNNAN